MAIINTDPVYDPIINHGDINDGDINDGDINDGYINDGDINDGYINDGDINDGDINDGDILNIINNLRGHRPELVTQEIPNGTVVIINRGEGMVGALDGIECKITGYNRITGQYNLINNVTMGVVGSMTKDQFIIKGVKTMEEWYNPVTMDWMSDTEKEAAYGDYLKMLGGSKRTRPKRRKTQKRRTQKRKTTKRKTTKKKKKTRKKKKRSTKRKRR